MAAQAQVWQRYEGTGADAACQYLAAAESETVAARAKWAGCAFPPSRAHDRYFPHVYIAGIKHR